MHGFKFELTLIQHVGLSLLLRVHGYTTALMWFLSVLSITRNLIIITANYIPFS